MTPTVHKVLMHGGEILKSFIVPIGCLSEEAQESRNKDFKAFRQNLARKFSRKKNLEDIFKRFLITSDPLLASKRVKKTHISRDVDLTELLNEEGVNTLSQEDNFESD